MKIKFYFLWAASLLSGLLAAQTDPFANTSGDDYIPLSALPKEKIDTSIVEEIELPALTDEERRNQTLDSIVNAELGFNLPIITCRQLHELQKNSSNAQKLYILDARRLDEFNVSHIPNARRIGLEDFSTESVWTYNRKATIVIYSLTGEQGEDIGLQMRKMGFKNVYNLYGSLVEWANQGLPLVDAKGHNTNKVFMRNKSQAKALKKGKAVY